jgi:signal transduction histidine kinase
VSQRRVALEVALLAFVLTLLVAVALWPGTTAGVPLARAAFDLGVMYVGLLTALLGALRLRRAGDWRLEAVGLGIVTLATWAGSTAGQVAGASSGRESLETWATSVALGGVSAIACAISYVCFRGLALAWPIWNRLRRTRLLFSITHAQLLASLLVAIGAAAVITVLGLNAGTEAAAAALQLDSQGGSQHWLVLRVLPAATAILVLSLLAALAILPVAALISYLALRRPTQRLGELAQAAEMLRGGDYSARVTTAGEDEVARLQTSFNAMASDLQRTLDQLQAERDRVTGLLEARRQLVASVSHELRTPVATVRGHLELAEAHGALGPEELSTVQSEITRLERLIDDLFSLSRAEVGQLDLRVEPTDVGVLVRRVSAALAPSAWMQRRVEVLATTDNNLPLAMADAQRLEQVVSNLLSNAARHTPPGGLVVANVSAGSGLSIEVRDTGAGIPADDLAHVFERFYRGEDSDGAGLGLALARDLTEAMGGVVEAESIEGQGSRFIVRLPPA